MALSTEVAHPWGMDGRQIAFSLAIPGGVESLTGAENRRHLETPTAKDAARNL
jgi:hypothetical protein